MRSVDGYVLSVMGTASEGCREDGAIVGCEEELAVIRQGIEVTRTGQGRLVIVEGGPGSGKTRLAESAAMEARRQGLRVVWLPHHGDGGWAVVEAVMDDAARGRPVILIDDATGGDLSDQLISKAGDLVQLPIVALVTTRSPGPAVVRAWAGNVVTRVRLRPLRAGTVFALAARMGVGVPIDVLERLHAATSGNALFVVETLTAIDERGALVEGDPWPLSERAVLWMRAQLDAASPAVRDAVEAASVVGRAGTVALVAEVIGGEVDLVGARSALDESAFTTVPPAGDHWRFTPPLARDLIYAGLSARRRATLHARLENVLASNGTSPAILLAHRTLAAAAAGDVRRCEHYLLRLVEEHTRPEAPIDAASWPYFVREGEHWAIGFGGRAVRLNHRAGLLYLAHLLSRPNVEFAALALSEGRRLRNVIGIDGNESSADAERARVRVTRRVRDGIERIAQAHPELGAHLERTIRTGARCVYVADPASAPRWEVRWSG